MVDVKAIFERVGVELDEGIYGMSPSPLPRMKQLVKLMPAVEDGECTLADINIYLNDIRSARIEADANSKMASEKTIRKCWNLLKEAKQKYPHLEKYPLAQAAYLIHKGETVKPAPIAVPVVNAVPEQIKANSDNYVSLVNNGVVNGKRLINETDFNILEHIKATDPAYYNTVAVLITEDLRAKAEAKLEEWLKEQAERKREELYAQMGIVLEPLPVVQADNPAELPAAEQTASAFTPAEPKAKKGKESDADFLDRVKALICENKDLNNDDYQRLLALKSKNNAVAAELVDLWETSPETSPEAPQGDKK
ncbi:Uncharacterised protein [Klebsiella quasipneumoniae]|uniref:hypothetical protein n=1 Tax=Klebsiella quasipneumoniae TaxID=1463165 RepID=UPI0010D27B7B|nr:hypothetical protein [Klebsiella quasipneumoniae]MCW9408705.1 hypothetical protein [Klebsiella quasipneumoniae]SSD82177.1 Uncharacterised protein [Klebsiella quasipneumoniae]